MREPTKEFVASVTKRDALADALTPLVDFSCTTRALCHPNKEVICNALSAKWRVKLKLKAVVANFLVGMRPK